MLLHAIPGHIHFFFLITHLFPDYSSVMVFDSINLKSIVFWIGINATTNCFPKQKQQKKRRKKINASTPTIKWQLIYEKTTKMTIIIQCAIKNDFVAILQHTKHNASHNNKRWDTNIHMMSFTYLLLQLEIKFSFFISFSLLYIYVVHSLEMVSYKVFISRLLMIISANLMDQPHCVRW